MIRTRHAIYLTQADDRILRRLAKERNQSRSAVVRKLLQTYKYIENLKEIEANNKIISGYLKEFTHIGTNINQIAYHLNANIIELIKKIQELGEKVKTLKIDINVEHTKTPSKKVEERENDG